MTDLPAFLVPALGAVLLDFLWQGALVGALAWCALGLLRSARPQARYAVACLALLACVLLPAWGLLQAVATHAAQATSALPDTTTGTAAAFDGTTRFAFDALPAPPDALLPWIVAAWACGAGLLALRMLSGLLWVQRLRAVARMPDTDALQRRLDALALRFGLHRGVALRIVADGDSPLSAGWWRPVVLVPAALALRMPAHLLEALLAHELAHIRRHDYLVNLLQGVVEVLLFYHPVTWWLSRRIRIERELVADDLAASVLGEPRRLAIALSELDRHAVPFPTFVQAAHGGQLMSRIQQLVRPDRRKAGSLVVLPLIGLAAAGLAFYAHARYAPQPHGTAAATATSAAPVALSAAGQAAALPAPQAQAAPRPITRIAGRGERKGNGYALVRAGEEGFAMSGDLEDVDVIRAARQDIDGDFLWVRRDGKPYIVRDAALLARAEDAWKPTQALEKQMQALDAQMEPHNRKLQMLSSRMDRLSARGEETDAMRAASKQMEALSEQQAALSRRQAALSRQLMRADAARQGALRQQASALEAEQQALGERMERQGAILEAESERLETKQAPMEALGREMEAASAPMQALGHEMEALGKQMEQAAAVADGKVHALVDDAFGRGLATPAPAHQ